MAAVPETRYVPVGGSDVAYQVVGGGGSDLLWCYGLGSNLELAWEFDWVARPLSRLGSVGRLILFDRRGTGLSGRLSAGGIPTWEELAEDITAVLDAVGSTRTAMVSTLEAGAMAILYAAMHPERLTSLMLLNTTARFPEAGDYPIGVPPAAVEGLLQFLGASWGELELNQAANPTMTEFEHRQSGRMQRASATPREAVMQYEYFMWNVDVRAVLPLVRVPTLVMHSADNEFIPVAHGRYIAEQIPDAKFVELSGGDTASFPDAAVDECVAFLTGSRPILDADRILTTILFTDIVGSTEQAASLGDHRWRVTLDAHDDVVRNRLQRFRGHEIKTTGDGFLASFDGPARAVRCGREIVDAAADLGIAVRVGIHTGECEVRGDDLGGLSVHIGARVGALAAPGEVLVSAMVRDLTTGSGIVFADRGDHRLKGVPGTWRLYAVE